MRFELIAVYIALGVAVGGLVGILNDGNPYPGAAFGMLVGFMIGGAVEWRVFKKRAGGRKDG